MRERRQADENAGRERPHDRVAAPCPQDRQHGRQFERGEQVLGDDHPRELDQRRVDGRDRDRDQRHDLAEALERDQADQHDDQRAKQRIGYPRGCYRSARGRVVPGDQVDGGKQVGEGRRKVGGRSVRSARSGVGRAVVARVGNLAGQHEVGARVADRAVCRALHLRNAYAERERDDHRGDRGARAWGAAGSRRRATGGARRDRAPAAA